MLSRLQKSARARAARVSVYRGTSVALLAACLGVGVGGCEKVQSLLGKSAAPAAAAAPAAMPPAPVQVVEAITKDVPTYLDEIGNASAVETVQLKSMVAGQITEVNFKDGDEIKKGQVLVRIDPRWYQAQLDQAKANLVRAQAVLQLAKADLARAEEAIAGKLISQEQYDTRKNAVVVAEAEIKQRQADEVAAQVNLDYCTIASPIDGRAGKRLMDVGNVVKANDDNALVVIQRMDPIYADFTIPENRLTEVRQHLAAGTVKALVRLPGEAEEAGQEGALTFLDNMVQDNSGRIRLRATVPNAERHFWPGQYVNVRLILNIEKNAVLVPTVAQQVGQQGPFVYVVKDGKDHEGKPATTAEMRPVVAGQRHGDLFVVEKGVSAGERVITVGQAMVMPGGAVNVLPAAPSPNASAAAH